MHTPTPWKICGGYTPSYTCVMAEDQFIIFGMADRVDHKENGRDIKAPAFDEQRENVKRIVACVNACEGINPDEIKNVVYALKKLLELCEGRIDPSYPAIMNAKLSLRDLSAATEEK